MNLHEWKTLIERARVGNTLHELNSTFSTTCQIRIDRQFGKSLNEALLNLGKISLQVRFEYGRRSNEIVFVPLGHTVYAFTQEHLDSVLAGYASDFRLLTHNLHTGTQHLFFYSRSADIIISTTKPNSHSFGPISVTRKTSNIIEYISKRKSIVYRRWKYNFSDPDEFVDVRKTVSYVGIPFAQVKKLIGAGVSELPIRT